jgi:hypothetical protein
LLACWIAGWWGRVRCIKVAADKSLQEWERVVHAASSLESDGHVAGEAWLDDASGLGDGETVQRIRLQVPTWPSARRTNMRRLCMLKARLLLANNAPSAASAGTVRYNVASRYRCGQLKASPCRTHPHAHLYTPGSRTTQARLCG